MSENSSADFHQAQIEWSALLEREKDATWLDKQKAANEKFGMHMSAARMGLQGIQEADKHVNEGKTSQAEALKLIESNKDGLSLWLDKKVGSEKPQAMQERCH